MESFQRIAITGKPNDSAVTDTIGRLVERLESLGRTVHVDSALALEGSTADDTLAALSPVIDLLIVVGGDGTLLHAAKTVAEHDVPVLGVNRGRLGFLVDVSPERFDEIEAVIDGAMTIEERLMLEARVRVADRVVAEAPALNDVVLQKWNTSRMIEFETWIDGEPCNRHRSDGLIISTPTGSTAYALSGGGPIMHPGIHAMALVPVCPHTLSNRPLVISADSRVEVRVAPEHIHQVHVSCDGQTDLTLEDGVRAEIVASPHRLRLVHPPGHRYFDILRAKLRWGDGAAPC
ncbi:NAD(+) kinase [Spiribacter pallidus]|uniref:NAD(+) kinase n=1 Tax=Spiribacter pallidus TaxID=1987936 RepID=UPI0034A08E94